MVFTPYLPPPLSWDFCSDPRTRDSLRILQVENIKPGLATLLKFYGNTCFHAQRGRQHLFKGYCNFSLVDMHTWRSLLIRICPALLGLLAWCYHLQNLCHFVCIGWQWVISSARISLTHNCFVSFVSVFYPHTYVCLHP